MLISVAIPAFNEEKLLPQTLAAVEKAQTAFTERGWETEVVICDNNSTDATAKLAEAAGARVVFEPVNQISRARNAAGNAARGDWIVFLDADSTPCPALMGKMATLMEDQAVIGAGVQIMMEGITLSGRAGILFWNTVSRLFRWPAGSFILCRAEAFRQLDGFSENLYAAEELEFDHRLKQLGRLRGQRVEILRQPRLLTSNRRMVMYSPFRIFGFIAITCLTLGFSLQRKSMCNWWYDGRR